MLAPDALREFCNTLADELECQRLEVMLAPTRRRPCNSWDMVRVVVSHNPDWYRNLCALYRSHRVDACRWAEFKTAIKRFDTLRALRRMARGDFRGAYAERILTIVKKKARVRAMQEAHYGT